MTKKVLVLNEINGYNYFVLKGKKANKVVAFYNIKKSIIWRLKSVNQNYGYFYEGRHKDVMAIGSMRKRGEKQRVRRKRMHIIEEAL